MTAKLVEVSSSTAATPRPRPFTVVPPPASVQRFDPQPGEGPASWALYSDHAAYASLVANTTFASRLRSLLSFARYFTLILTKRLISYELIPAHIRAAGGFPFFARSTRHVWEKLVGGPAPAADSAGEPVAKALAHDGFCLAPIDNAHFQAISLAVQPLLDDLRYSRGTRIGGGREFEESRTVALRTANADLYSAVEKMFRESGILAGISKYIGCEARLADVNPQINDASDDFWQHVFPDLPVESRPTPYFHRDASGGDVKAIVYLSDVGPDFGPFSYAIGSHRARGSTLSDWVEETNDQSGFSGTDKEARRRFSALPAILRRKCAFGNDLVRGQPIAQRILDAEWVICADRSHVAVFDTKGFHRGGMVKAGERIVLTCIIGSPQRRRSRTTNRGR